MKIIKPKPLNIIKLVKYFDWNTDKQINKTDDLFNIERKCRRRIQSMFRRMKEIKTDSTTQYLGADFNTIKQHIESQFKYGMSWNDDLHIDHIIPLASGKTLEEKIPLLHYTNLQPLPKSLNLEKYNNTWTPEYTDQRLQEFYNQTQP